MNDAYDTSSLFMLQLSCIIKMIAVYKKHILRVHLLNTIDIQSQRVQLKQLLSMLRIKASIHEVSATVKNKILHFQLYMYDFSGNGMVSN